MDVPDLEHALACARDWSRQAGTIAVNRLGKQLSVRRKPDCSLVSEVDLELQELIVGHIRREFPGHGIIAEETTDEQHQEYSSGEIPTCLWIVDPLDGTRNYTQGLPLFAVAIALIVAGRPLVAIVHDPNCGRTYTAIRGRGAYLDQAALQVSTRRLSQSPLLAIPTAKNHPLPAQIYRDWSRIGVLRHTGSTCLNLALTACGALDASFGQEVKLWDIAAGALLIEEAGGLITTPEGETLFPLDPGGYGGGDFAFVAGGQVLHGELIESLRR